jgi:hypothetical protein
MVMIKTCGEKMPIGWGKKPVTPDLMNGLVRLAYLKLEIVRNIFGSVGIASSVCMQFLYIRCCK